MSTGGDSGTLVRTRCTVPRITGSIKSSSHLITESADGTGHDASPVPRAERPTSRAPRKIYIPIARHTRGAALSVPFLAAERCPSAHTDGLARSYADRVIRLQAVQAACTNQATTKRSLTSSRCTSCDVHPNYPTSSYCACHPSLTSAPDARRSGSPWLLHSVDKRNHTTFQVSDRRSATVTHLYVRSMLALIHVLQASR